MRENLFELDINSHEQRLLLGVKGFNTKLNKKLRNSDEEKSLNEVQ